MRRASSNSVLGSSSIPMRWCSRTNGFGAHQTHLPRTCMKAGTRHHPHQRGIDHHGQRQAEPEQTHDLCLGRDQRRE
jgi:hypothetical protein